MLPNPAEFAKLECLKLAHCLADKPAVVVQRAKAYYRFIASVTPSKPSDEKPE